MPVVDVFHTHMRSQYVYYKWKDVRTLDKLTRVNWRIRSVLSYAKSCHSFTHTTTFTTKDSCFIRGWLSYVYVAILSFVYRSSSSGDKEEEKQRDG